ncbi:NAD-dependent epimerase/dehydratase family protein [Luteimonas sp. FXH3W]|uniref:NAD-dependent epimerase/dehydratase family protein n=1 Tax=Aquilutibacter rugosus TaxID=3115820 RepID=A0ABU7UXH1_9GAMM
MIVGNGLVASHFRRLGLIRKDTVIFASGVSNSRETRTEAFQRERSLLQTHLNGTQSRLVYFSSFGVATEEYSPYLEHKRQMEDLVASKSAANLIFRLPQVVGKSENPNTLANAMIHNIGNDLEFEVWAYAERNFIDIEHVASIAHEAIAQYASGIIPIMSERSLSMPEIVRIFEEILDKPAKFRLIETGAPMPADTSKIRDLAKKLGIELGGDYARRVLKRYYG